MAAPLAKADWGRLSFRARALLLWLLVVTAAPGALLAVAEALGDPPAWLVLLPWAGLGVALASLLAVAPPRSASPSLWLGQLRARLQAEIR